MRVLLDENPNWRLKRDRSEHEVESVPLPGWAGIQNGALLRKAVVRNTKELLEFADYFREHYAGLISIAETIDASSPAGRLFFTIIAAMARWEREEILVAFIHPFFTPPPCAPSAIP